MISPAAIPYMSPDDLASVVFHLRSGMVILERQKALTVADISVKTLLGVLQKEMHAKLRIAEQLPQWSDSEAARTSLRRTN